MTKLLHPESEHELHHPETVSDDFTNDSDQTISQYVTFHIADEVFGFPMQQVAEIIRLPETISVPLTPESLLGLSNLRGNILPVLDLRRILQFNESKFSDATRVIVTDSGNILGFVVDKVSRVMSIDQSSIEHAENVKSSVNSDLFSGVIREGNQLIQLLDIHKLIDLDFDHLIKEANSDLCFSGQTHLINDNTEGNNDDEEISQVVTFIINNQEYAIDLMGVEEIVRIPDSIAKVPVTEQHVLGIINLRGRVLPLVNMRKMFDFNDLELSENHRILVINLRSAGGIKNSVGIVVDDVREVMHIAMNMRDPVPSIMKKSQTTEIDSISRLEDGKRIISILNVQSMFDHPFIQTALAEQSDQSSNHEGEFMNNQEQTTLTEEDSDETQMVVFKLADQEYGVTIDDVQEITRVPEEMNKVPKTPEFIEGMINLRGTILPVIDMRGRFGLEKIGRNERQRILVLNINGHRTGFIMDSVVEVLRLNRKNIEAAPDLSEEQAKLMGHVVNLKEEKRMIQVLNVHELLNENEEAFISNTKQTE